MKSALAKILRLVAGVAMLVWLVVWVDWRQLVAAVLRCNPWWVAAGMALFCVSTIPAALRLQVLFRRNALSFGSALRLTLASYFFNQVLPTGLGGDVYRTVRLKEERGGWISTVGLVLLERAIGAGALIVPALVFAIVQHGGDRVVDELRGHLTGSRALPYAVVATVIVAVAASISFRGARHRLRDLLRELLLTLRHLSPTTVAVVVALSLLFHTLRVLGMRAFLEAIGSTVAIGDLVVVLALTLLASLVPVTIGALGVREGVLVYALGAFGVAEAEALTVALLARLVVVVLGAAGGVVFHADRTNAEASVDESGAGV